jgi:surface antigen
VPYARQVSGIDIRGDAWTWWSGAAGRYQRGGTPEAGAVLVMQATRVMRRGHLAVVESLVAPREIRVTQANWGYDRKTRGRVETGTPVIDVSEDNSWSAVRVWNRQTQAYGRVKPTFGFIYPRPMSLISESAAPATQLALCLPQTQ